MEALSPTEQWTKPPLLFLDDEPGVAKKLAANATGLFPTIECTLASEAKAILLGPDPLSGAVLDVVLADGDGVDVGKQTRSHRRDLPILLISRACHRDQLACLVPYHFEFAPKLGDRRPLLIWIGLRAAEHWTRDPAILASVADDALRFGLTPIQIEVLTLKKIGFSNKQIADRRGVSLHAVHSETHDILGVYKEHGVQYAPWFDAAGAGGGAGLEPAPVALRHEPDGSRDRDQDAVQGRFRQLAPPFLQVVGTHGLNEVGHRD